MEELRGRVAVVTGGGGGIGKAMAVAFANEGMDVVIGEIEMDMAAEAVAAVEAAGTRAIAVRNDVTDRASMGALAEAARDAFGGAHVLCNNAGVVTFTPIHELDEADWDWVIGVNLLGALYGVQAFLGRMVAQGEPGHIVNTASIAGLVSHPGIASYNVSKFGVVALTESLRLDLAETQVSASVLCPGGVRTRIMESDRNRPAALGGPGDYAERAGTQAPAPIEPAEVAARVLAAIRADAPYIVTHKEQKAMVEGRFGPILAAFDAL